MFASDASYTACGGVHNEKGPLARAFWGVTPAPGN
jgi:hypothetical protein